MKKNKKIMLYSAIATVIIIAIAGFLAFNYNPEPKETSEDIIINNLISCIKTNCSKLETQGQMTNCTLNNCYVNHFYPGVNELGYAGAESEELRFISNLHGINQEFYICKKEASKLANEGYSYSGNYSAWKCLETRGVRISWKKMIN